MMLLGPGMVGRVGTPARTGAPAEEPPPEGDWIMAAGAWDDDGVWIDAETWND